MGIGKIGSKLVNLFSRTSGKGKFLGNTVHYNPNIEVGHTIVAKNYETGITTHVNKANVNYKKGFHNMIPSLILEFGMNFLYIV